MVQFLSNLMRTFLSLIIVSTWICPNIVATETVTIKAYCTGDASDPIPVYASAKIRIDACKQYGNAFLGVENAIGDFPFYYTFKYERNSGEDGNECKYDHEDAKDAELEEHLSFYHDNGKDEQLAILLRSYYNEKKELEEREKNFEPVNSLNDLGAMLRAHDNRQKGLAEKEHFEQVIKQQQMFGFLHPISEGNLERQKEIYDSAKNELDAYMMKMKGHLEGQQKQPENDDDEFNSKIKQIEEQPEQSEKDDDELNSNMKQIEESSPNNQ
ncbi:hypothetical protein niasHT_023693 [Heterodera trifolii]|uniref:Effector protein n=1 Tax=Heterodera trifolii TaxID=157864 RepID=A0ABD2JA06_9BILA